MAEHYMISHSKRFIFIHNPKTAGNSIQLALTPYIDGDFYCSQDKMEYEHHTQGNYQLSDKFGDMSKHTPLSEYMKFKEYQSYMKFTCVRNPWDRAISWLFYEIGEFDRDEFIKRIKNWYTMSSMVGHNDQINLDFIIRYENLKPDFENACHILGLDPIELPHVNKGSKQHYTHYYDDQLIELVRQKFQMDIQNFNYTYGD